MSGAFDNLYRHGFVRAAAAAPLHAVADPEANVAEIVRLARQADADQAALVLFPELCVTAYAIDDLLLQAPLLNAAERAVTAIAEQTKALSPLVIVGAPVRVGGALYNCALVIHRGLLLGVIPKSYLPNYREYYEKRHFAEGGDARETEISFAGQTAPFGTDLLFAAKDVRDFVLNVEICEDFWAPIPPSSFAALAGATILVNLSASNSTIGKADERNMLAASQSARAVAAYVYAAAGPGESTTDLAWDGHLAAFEVGEKIAEADRFQKASAYLTADIDVERIALERARFGTFRDCAARNRVQAYRRITFELKPSLDAEIPLRCAIARFPFVPDDPNRLDQDCYEAFNIQVQGLAKRLHATGIPKAVIGVSGGLDSTHALLVAARAFALLDRPLSDIIALTLPGFATSDSTKSNAWKLMRALGVDAREVDIKPLAEQMLKDLDHPFARGEKVYDVTFENVQAGMRTDYLFRLANQENGLVVGTGDLSELALGWCTYGVGDHMSHYAVNAGVPKTLIQHLIRWCAERDLYGAEASATLRAILATEISPELIPADSTGALQSTESRIGPYALHDFFLHYTARYGLGPAKIAFLANTVWADQSAGQWPANLAETDRRAFSLDEIIHWLEVFVSRFFAQSQFKRSCIPNGAKISSAGALSPRGDWRAPSDASAAPWLAEISALKTELKKTARKKRG